MNTFDDFKLTGANATRYVPIHGNASGIIGAYRKTMGVKIKARVKHVGKIELGMVPLFLLDGKLSAKALNRAVETLGLTAYVAIYRPFDSNIKTRFEKLYKTCCKRGYFKKDGSCSDWITEDLQRYETGNIFAREFVENTIGCYLDYKAAQAEYTAISEMPPIDAATGKEIIGDLNTFLFERAMEMFPYGVENLLESNVKQSEIPKHKFFMGGMELSQEPKGVRKNGGQMSLFDLDKPSISDTISELQRLIKQSISQNGAARLSEIIEQCAQIGLYKGDVALYVMGAAFRDFNMERAVFYDGVAYLKYTEVLDISSWILQAYELHIRNLARSARNAALFFDDTDLKERLEDIFNITPTQDKRFDTLGMAVLLIRRWIVENLRYPIAFLDGTIYSLLRSDCIYGEKLKQYNTYFTPERCKWLKMRLRYADTIARQAIKKSVGFDPDTTRHGMSNLPKGHYAPVLYSADAYINAMSDTGRIAA